MKKNQLYLLMLGVVLIENGMYISLYILNWNHEAESYENYITTQFFNLLFNTLCYLTYFFVYLIINSTAIFWAYTIKVRYEGDREVEIYLRILQPTCKVKLSLYNIMYTVQI